MGYKADRPVTDVRCAADDAVAGYKGAPPVIGADCAVDDVVAGYKGYKGALLPVTPSTSTTTLEPGVGAERDSGGRRRAALGVAMAVVAAGLLLVGFVSPAVAVDTCSNAALRAENASPQLPDCRGYEMVTPPYKEGFPAYAQAGTFTDDGVLQYGSLGSFAGNGRGVLVNTYRATRSPVGWLTTSTAAPGAIYDTGGAATLSQSADLRLLLTQAVRRALPGDKLGFWLRGPDGGFTRIGDAQDALGTRVFVGSSPDLSHIVFNHGPQGAGITQMYEYVGTGNDGPARPVSVDNHGQALPDLICNPEIPDNRVIIFMSGCSGDVLQVWARVGGTATVAVSGSECTRSAEDPGGVCNAVAAAGFAGRSADGSRVFFTTSQQLVNGDTDAGTDLYACDLPSGVPVPVGAANPCASLTQVSATEGSAQVDNVVAVSDDGDRVYFVAQGVLGDNLGVDGLGPATAADASFGQEPHNLYVWQRDGGHPAGQTRFVARLAGSTGYVGNDVGSGQVTPDGRYLLFVTANQLVKSGPGADEDSARDAYRYDAVTHSMVRVSTPVSGSGGNGPGPGADVLLVNGAPSMSADGSTVIFDSAEALSAGDTDGVTDVYRWRDGQVSLISAGGGRSVGITPSGRDIFFETEVPVLAADTDPQNDIYDARIGGGFTTAQIVPCSGDGCRGPRSQPPSLPGPLPAEPGGLGEVVASPAFSLRAVSAAQRRVLAATGKVSLVVTANAPGTITARATATIDGRPVTVGTGRRTLTAAGRVTVVLALSKKARSQLALRGRLSVKVAVSHSRVALDRSVTLRLVHAKAKAKAKRSARRAAVLQPVVGVGGGRS
jgi:hypothetical protein